MAIPQWLRNAFAVDAGPLEPTPEQADLVDNLAKEVVRRGMATPALAFLEMSQPLNYMASQAMVFFAPMISALTDSKGHTILAELLEHRGALSYICSRIESLSTNKSGDLK